MALRPTARGLFDSRVAVRGVPMPLPAKAGGGYAGAMTPLRPLLALCLALALCLGAVASGMARGQAPAVTLVTICAAGGAATVAVDADGRPVGQGRHCPDYLILKSALPMAASAPVFRAVWHAVAGRPASSTGSGAGPAAPRARGPPVLA